jgi:cyclic pyranopterin phosphate synthase
MNRTRFGLAAPVCGTRHYSCTPCCCQEDKNNQHDHAMFEDQMMELKEERDAVFGFTEEDRNVWSRSASGSAASDDFVATMEQHTTASATGQDGGGGPANHTIPAPVMEEINAARSRHFAQMDDVGSRGEVPLSLTATPQGTFTHLSSQGDSATMVDVGHKEVTRRTAKARSSVVFPPEVMDAFALSPGGAEMVGPKGPIFATAKLAGIMASKRTADLIPLCHPLPLDKVHIDIVLSGNTAVIECECIVTHKTGVEMEALTGATVAALTIYDMVKAVSHRVEIQSTQLVSKTGGKRTIEDGKYTTKTQP